ncbi:MAG TPA: ribosome-associated translation inhibitor RaiA [Oligoflexia bacterium]|nr:ribosome-associated translation inhibitor RaiA [Oligoflexia bacterium]HMP26634.1 ribosome-associated translation inhibitor RaiA [Oligoflexia bacterium]
MVSAPKNIQLSITFRGIESTPAIKSHAEEKISAVLKKFIHHDTEARLILQVQKKEQIAELQFHADGADFHCKEIRDDLYAAIDALVATAANQLRKHKEKITAHH